MASLSNEYCPRHMRNTSHINGHCGECAVEEAEAEFKEFHAMKIEDRIDWLFREVKRIGHGEAIY